MLFCMSSLHSIPGFFCLILVSTASLAISTTSMICLPLINAICWGSTNLPITRFSLSVNTLDSKFYMLHIRLIGLKSLSSFAPFFFDVSAMKVELKLFSKNFLFMEVMKNIHYTLCNKFPILDEEPHSESTSTRCLIHCIHLRTSQHLTLSKVGL